MKIQNMIFQNWQIAKINSEIFDDWNSFVQSNHNKWILVTNEFNLFINHTYPIIPAKHIFSDRKNNILKTNNDIFHHLNQINRILNQFKEIKNYEI